MGGFWSNDGQISGSSSWDISPLRGQSNLWWAWTSHDSLQWSSLAKKTHSFNSLNMFESSSLMFFSIRHTLFSSQTCCWFAERPFSLGQVSHVVRQYSPCCWPLSPLPLLANIIWRIHLCWWTSPPKKHINPVNDTPHISQCPTKSYMTLATLAAHSTEWSAISRLSDGPAYNGGRT